MSREALRQQMLLRALWRDDAAALHGWVRASTRASTRAAASHGLAVYRSNAGALAERALGSAYPTIAALVGAESFAALARHFWHLHPPVRGDVGAWGDALPAFIAESPQLADEPYLADSARLDWSAHAASRAADDNNNAWPPSLSALTSADPDQLRLQLAPGAAVVTSPWPIVTIWQAHHGGESFDTVRAALQAARQEAAFVWRDDGFVIHVEPLDAPDAAFTASALEGRSLAQALDAAGEHFAFERWLERALRSRWPISLHALHP